ncbi:MAG: hypothetical protein ACLFQ8_02035 [Candidatus Aenigmatarchaeota archaeon]
MSDKEKLGYHKGAMEALINEKIELSRLLKIVNSLIQRHSKSLEEMGVDVEKFIENVQKKREKSARKATEKSKRSSQDKGEFDLSDEELPEEF